ncbi:MFS transporter [Micromonosporaceae bacterium Da 78-11]
MLGATLPARPEARRLLVGVLLSAIGTGLTLPFLFLYLADVRGIADAVAGLSIGWYGVVVLVLSPVGGALMDRYGPRRVQLPSLLAVSLGTAALSVVDRPVAAFGALTLCGIGGASMWAGSATLLASLTGPDERQRVFGLQFALLNLGIGLGGMIAGAVIDEARPGTFQLIYLIDSATYLVPAAILLSMPQVGRRAPRDASAPTRSGGYRTVLADRPFRRLLVYALVLTTCGYAQIQVGFAAFSVRVAGVSPRVVAWALAANTIVIVAAQLLVVRRLEGRSRSRALAAVGVVFAASWLVLGGAGLLPGAGSIAAAVAVILCAAVFGAGETLLQPVLPALTNALAPDELRGRYNAANSILFGVGGIIAPITAGPLIGAGGGAIWVGTTIGGCLIASLLALSLRRLLSPAQDGRPTLLVAEDRP